MQVADLVADCAVLVHDPDYNEVSKDHWLTFIRAASQDMDSAGWMITANDDTSLTVIANQFVYDVPEPFAYITHIFIEEVENTVSNYTRMIPDAHWTLRVQGSKPVIQFYSLGSLEVGRKLQVVGQKRPTVYTSLADTLDGGTESYMRERAIGYAARFLGAGLSEYAKWRQVVAGQAMQASERTLRLMPQEFRMAPDSKIVPTREG